MCNTSSTYHLWEIANHVQHTERLSPVGNCKSCATHWALSPATRRATCHMVWRDSSVIKFDRVEIIFMLAFYFMGWTIKPMMEVRKPMYMEKTPGDELQKMPHTKAWRFKPQVRLEPTQQHWWQARKADMLTTTPRGSPAQKFWLCSNTVTLDERPGHWHWYWRAEFIGAYHHRKVGRQWLKKKSKPWKNLIFLVKSPQPVSLPLASCKIRQARASISQNVIAADYSSSKSPEVYVWKQVKEVSIFFFSCDCLVGQEVKASISRAEDPRFKSRLRQDFFGAKS